MRISDWSSDVCSSDLFDVRFITKLVICDRVFQDRVVTRCHNGETVEKKMFASQIAYVIDWVFERTLGYGQAKVQVAFLHPLKRVDGQIDDLEANAGCMAAQMTDEGHANEFPHVRDRKSTRLNSSH